MTRRIRGAAWLSRFVRSETAGPIVEFAVVAPVLMLIVGGIIDFSRAFIQRSNLVTAVREGARFAAVQPSVCTSEPLIRARVANRFTAFSGPELLATQIAVEFLTEENVRACTAGAPFPTKIRVRITGYRFRPFVPLPQIMVPDGIQLGAEATFRWERVD
jgi:Flp pilus assembly protein TadG